MSQSVASNQSPRLLEALCDFSRQAHTKGKGRTDHPDMTIDFACRFYDKAFHLQTNCTQCELEPEKDTDEDDLLDSDVIPSHGQAGFIVLRGTEESNLVESSEAEVDVVCVTAKHNVGIYSKADEFGTLWWFLPDEPSMFSFLPNRSRRVLFQEGDFRCKKNVDDAFFGFGIDITSSRLPSMKQPRFRAFELVRDGFQYKKELRIGIAVFRNFDVLPHHAGVDITLDQFIKAFGPIDDIRKAIYTGMIRDVHENSIEHTINTFEGCSGAIVFLLEGQENPTDDGKAIAVHACSTRSGKNYAFILKREHISNGV